MINLSSIKIKASYLIELTCILWLLNAPLKRFFARILGIVGLTKYNQLIVGILTFMPLLIYILKFKKVPFRYFNIVFLLCALFFSITYLLNPEILYWYNREIFGISYTVFRPDHGAIWAFLIIELLHDEDRIWKVFKIYSIFLFVYNMFLLYVKNKLGYWLVFDFQGTFVERNYSLDFGYDMAFIVIFLLASYFYDKKLYKIIMSIPCIILIILQGSRGAFLCILSAIVLLTLYNADTKKAKIGTLIFGTIIFFMTYLLLIDNDLKQILYSKLNSLGFQSRTIDMIISGEVFEDSGREVIYDLIKVKLNKNPWGFGAYGDRPIVGPYFYWGYSHNIFYEMAANFGIIPSFIILGIILLKSIDFILDHSNIKISIILIILLSMSMKLLISDTFWGYKYFWMLIAFIFIFRKDEGVKKSCVSYT
ncbi:MAG: O-antigen ligase family protein [Lagierella massiliensis]|nr:O-antigen ligase family protein [Lagierella massiliensis]